MTKLFHPNFTGLTVEVPANIAEMVGKPLDVIESVVPIDLSRLRLMADAVMESAAYSKIFEVRAEKWITGDYDDPTAELAIQLKDKDVIRDFAAALDCPTPMFDATMPYYIAAASQGRQQQDAASILAVLEHMAGIPRDAPPSSDGTL